MGIFTKTAEYLKDRLGKTRDKISSSLSSVLTLGRNIDENLLDELEETLIGDDIGVETTDKLISDLRTAFRSRQIATTDDIIPFLKEHMKGYWPHRDRQLHLAQAPPTVILIAGVNGSGKTTSIAKLAHILSRDNKKVIVAACDTFRAAAVEQLTIWAERIGVQIVKHKTGGDPAAVAFDACEAALARDADILILDTAGRLHTQKDLMRQLTKIRDVVTRKIPDAPNEVLLVLDATTGQNAIAQAKMFTEAIDVTGIFLAKLDGTARGGIVIAIKDQLDIPVKFVGLGEKPTDIAEFDPDTFVEALFGPAEPAEARLVSTPQTAQVEKTAAPKGPFRNFAQRVLTHRRLAFILAILAVMLTLPALNAGWLVDDHIIRLTILGSSKFKDVFDSQTAIFKVFDGDPERTGRMMDYGIAPWWTYKKIKGSFCRPVTVLTHLLDYHLWPKNPALMHAHSLLWFGIVVAVVTLLYRRFIGLTWIAGLAALLYAIDDAHGFGAGYLAGRNTLLYVLFGFLTLIVHDYWRRDNWRAGVVVGPLLLLLSLLSHEAGVTTCAYLAAYAVFVDRGTWRQRCIALVPYVAIVLAWRLIYTHLGYGVSGIGFYADPLNEPLRYLTWLKVHAPILLLSQWALPPSDITMILTPNQIHILWLIALAFLVLLALILIPLLRKDRLARFWALGMVLSLFPICTAFPMDRHLFFVGLGAMGLLAQFLAGAFGRVAWRPNNLTWRSTAVTLGIVFLLIHLLIAPMALPFRAGFPVGPKEFVDQQSFLNTPMDTSVEQQDVVIVNPLSPVSLFLPIVSELKGQPVPKHIRALAPGWASMTIHRPDMQTLLIRPKYGYLASIGDRVFRSEQYPMSLGEQVELTGMTVKITKMTGDGRPYEAAFRFDVPLEDTSLRWLQWDWKNNSCVLFNVPAIGESCEIEGLF